MEQSKSGKDLEHAGNLLPRYIIQEIINHFRYKVKNDDPSHPCSQPQGKLDPLVNGEDLWYNVCNHGNKFFKHPIMNYNSLLNGFPDCCRHHTNWRYQESQNRKGKLRTCMIIEVGHFNNKCLLYLSISFN